MSTATAPPQRPPVAPPPRRRWPWVLVALVVLLGLAAAAVVVTSVIGAVGGRTTSTTRTVVDDPVDVVEVDVEAGPVVVEPGDGDTVELVATRRWTVWGDPTVEHTVRDGRLRVEGRCTAWFTPWCETGVRLSVPRDVTVTLSTEAGSIEVRDLTGDVTASSSAGSVRLTDVTGDVDLETSAGSIDARGLDSERVEARSSAGGVTVVTDTAPDRVVAATNAGSVEVVVPDETYDVDADTSAGSVTVDVVSDPSASRSIEARSDAGRVTVRPR